MGLYFIAASASFVMLVCLVLAFHKDYHTGVIGTVAFALIAVAGLARVENIFSHAPALTPVSYMLWTGLALYFGQLAWRFSARLRRRGKPDWYDNGRSSEVYR